MLFDAEKIYCLERIENFVENVCALMFLRVHLKPCASDGPENAIFLRDLLLFFNQSTRPNTAVRSQQKVIFETCYFATTWLNPTNVAVSGFYDSPPFPLSAVLATEQSLPSQVHTHEMLWI